MMHASGRSNRFVLAALALMCVGAVACHEDAVAPKVIQTPSGPMRDLGTVIVHVDMKNHRIEVTPVSATTNNLPPGVEARFFGSTSQIEYALTEGPTNTPLGGTDIEYHIRANISNLLDSAIGTNSPHTYPAVPQDTMGIYVYYAIPPYNFQSLAGPCAPSACTVVIDSADGAFPFTSGQPQQYVFWKAILEGGGTNAQVPGPFETNQTGTPGAGYFRHMAFHTHGNMTDFSFGLSVAAAWVDPQEARWKVSYVGDSLPTRLSLDDLRSEPDWRRLGTTGATTITPANCTPNTGACNLTLVGTAGDTLIFFRSDSLRASQSGYMAATLSLSTLTGAQPGVFMGLKDPVKLVQMGISTSTTGFTDSLGILLPAYSFPTVLGRTSYRIAKFTNVSAAIYSPAVSTTPLMTIPYASLPPAPVRGSGPPNYDRFFFFGNLTASAGATAATSLWSNVNYEIGAAAP
ncbi:MAG: hypothetical protein ABI311_08730 [Gemmatimonadaceae bacterium]